MRHTRLAPASKGAFVDLFSGCGGLSLGLMQSGWRGLFAIERDADAYQTLSHNLVEKTTHNLNQPKFHWPKWLSKSPHEIKHFTERYRENLVALRGKVQLVVGGPPCQGFSAAGRRDAQDSRNKLFQDHIGVVKILQPEAVMLENVPGICATYFRTSNERSATKNFGERIRSHLERCGYVVQQGMVLAADFGVPQLRKRWLTIGFRRDLFDQTHFPDFFSNFQNRKNEFLGKLGLPTDRHVTVSEAISDLQVTANGLVECGDRVFGNGFKEALYQSPKSEYQKLMHGNMNGRAVNSLRLARHRSETVERFELILKTCKKGVPLSEKDRRHLGLKKRSTTPLDPDRPSPTITTLPDDLIHYSEPRIHTVRECARLQSFPDWFEFCGKYTTGGKRRRHECPRYTQVGNAVPPLLATAIGRTLANCLSLSEVSELSKSRSLGWRSSKNV